MKSDDLEKELLDLKNNLVEICKLMYHYNFSAPNDGNVSFRINDRIFISQSGKHKARLSAEDIIEVDLSGKQISKYGKASTETALHLQVYAERDDIAAVVHAHPPYGTAFAVANLALEKNTMSEIISSLGTIPLAKYGTPATKELPDSIRPFVKNCNAILLANHGVITYGKDLESAWYAMERLEHYARISFYARLLGGEQVISDNDVDKLLKIRKDVYNISDPLIIKKNEEKRKSGNEILKQIDQLKNEILKYL